MNFKGKDIFAYLSAYTKMDAWKKMYFDILVFEQQIRVVKIMTNGTYLVEIKGLQAANSMFFELKIGKPARKLNITELPSKIG